MNSSTVLFTLTCIRSHVTLGISPSVKTKGWIHGGSARRSSPSSRCEGMSTYPRTYDLIHADSVFTLYRNREKILLVVKTYWTTHEAMTKISSRTVNTCSDRKFNMWGKEG
ncbi:hypothetical protein ACJX0J_007123, partial [Zea mays]